MKLLSQIKAYPDTKAGRRTGERTGNDGIMYRPLKICLYGKLFVKRIVDIGSQLEVDISISNRSGFTNLALEGAGVYDGYIEAEGNVIL